MIQIKGGTSNILKNIGNGILELIVKTTMVKKPL